jgi:demethylmenaquinone methyltransferase/2-methoxy-6-polyprenyl-1,4-benzoquinol methylase
MPQAINTTALRLFAPLAEDYGTWSRLLSFWQDPRWRRAMVGRLELPAGSRILDVAAGTGEVTRILQRAGHAVISLDQSREMLGEAAKRGAAAVIGRAENLPFADNHFDALTFTYLLRYVEDQPYCMRELARVIRPGGKIGMVEFGRPRGAPGMLWLFYTGVCLPLAGRCISRGWHEVGAFLRPSIEGFWRKQTQDSLVRIWQDTGFDLVRLRLMSLGGGIVMTGRKR